MPPTVGAVVLTQGKRPAELAAAVKSILDQHGVTLDLVIVGNGWDPVELVGGLPDRVKSHALPENLGIPAGRNAGVPLVNGEYLLFLDDDALLASSDFLAVSIGLLESNPAIGLIQPQVIDQSGAPNPRRWIPRIKKGSPSHSSAVFSVWEGALVARRSVFDQVGGWGDEYFYAHEGIELAWRFWDAGAIVWYAGDLIANHPAIDPRRHDDYYRLNARNRVWLARRNLPAALIPLYVGSWTAIQIVRSRRDASARAAWFAGWREGWSEDPGARRAISWRTVATMTRFGRPPII